MAVLTRQFNGMIQMCFKKGSIRQLGKRVIVGKLKNLIFVCYFLGVLGSSLGSSMKSYGSSLDGSLPRMISVS